MRRPVGPQKEGKTRMGGEGADAGGAAEGGGADAAAGGTAEGRSILERDLSKRGVSIASSALFWKESWTLRATRITRRRGSRDRYFSSSCGLLFSSKNEAEDQSSRDTFSAILPQDIWPPINQKKRTLAPADPAPAVPADEDIGRGRQFTQDQ